MSSGAFTMLINSTIQHLNKESTLKSVFRAEIAKTQRPSNVYIFYRKANTHISFIS